MKIEGIVSSRTVFVLEDKKLWSWLDIYWPRRDLGLVLDTLAFIHC